MSLLADKFEYTNWEGKAVTYLTYKDSISIKNYRADAEAICQWIDLYTRL